MSKLDALTATLTGYGRVVVAFSGGVDSAFLLKVAVDALGDKCHAVTAVSPTMARSEIKEASSLAAQLGLGDRHHVVESHELEVPGFADNPTHRCALCKTELMGVATPIAAKLDDAPIVLGTNVDDLGDVRPGIAAARERGAFMPMVDAGLTKQEIRQLSKQLGLPTWDKPQLARLSSRFPYGTQITQDRLRRVDEFEEGLRDIGFRQLRVRFHDTIARLEIDNIDLPRVVEPGVRERIVALGKKLGFSYVALDLAGFRSGSLNEVLPADALVKLEEVLVVVKLAAVLLLIATPAFADAYQSKKDRERAAKTTQHPAPPAPGSKPAKLVNLYNEHTRDWLAVDPLSPPTLSAVSSFLRDHFTNEATKMDPKLISVVVAAAAQFKSDFVNVVSGFRHPKYNLILRKKGHQVARDSQHTHGNAIDFQIPTCSTKKLEAWAKAQKLGGVGVYLASGFVHMDTGPIRFWTGD